MVDEKLVSDFSFPASPGDYFPPIIGDPGEESAPTSPGRNSLLRALVLRSATQAITTATDTDILFDNEIFDDAGLFDTTANDRIMLPSPYTWFLSGNVSFALNATGLRSVTLFDPYNAASWGFQQRVPATAATLGTVLSVSAMVTSFGAAASVGLRVYQNSGGNLNVTARLSAHRILL